MKAKITFENDDHNIESRSKEYKEFLQEIHSFISFSSGQLRLNYEMFHLQLVLL